VTFALARSLLLADAVTPEALAHALLVSATRGTSLVRALLTTQAIDTMRLEQALERSDAPYMRHVAPIAALVQRLPEGLCERLLALPVRCDSRTGTVDVAVVDARDPHSVEEIAHWLDAPVRTVRTSLASMEAALRRMTEPADPGIRSLAPPMGVPPSSAPPRTTTPTYGSPAFDATLGVGQEIPIPLSRRSQPAAPLVELGPPAIERDARGDEDPVLDLRRRKSVVPSEAAPRSSPHTARGPFSPSASHPSLEDADPVLDAIRGASDRDRILELLVVGVRSVAQRVAVLAVRRDAIVGWTCTPDFGDSAEFRAVRLSVSARTVLSDTLKHDGVTLARLPRDAAHAPLLAAITAPPPGEVALVAVHAAGKPVAVVLADELGEVLTATERMQELARAAGEALVRLLRERRR
jgi:hypothetical protein